jgi:outer membrane protein OmpA-like peptidoglycan-associated protein
MILPHHSLSKIVLAVSLATAAAAAGAQDVKVFSRQEAEDVLADPTPAAAPDACPVRLPNGTCARSTEERGFSIARSRASSSTAGRSSSASAAAVNSSPGPRLVTPSGSKATGVAPGRKRQAVASGPRFAKGREVPLQFGLGSIELSPQSRANLQTLAGVLNQPQNRTKRIMITGHTDKSGSVETNRRLSQQRADAVAAFLSGQGVERARLDAQGRAFDDPLPGLSAFDARNRRVEVVRVD